MVHAIPGLEAILPPSLQSLGSKVGVLRLSWLQVGGLSCNIWFLGTFLDPSWRVLGPSWLKFRRCWLQVGWSWCYLCFKLGGLGSKLEDPGAILAPKCGVLVPNWRILRPCWLQVGSLGSILGDLEAILAPIWKGHVPYG